MKRPEKEKLGKLKGCKDCTKKCLWNTAKVAFIVADNSRLFACNSAKNTQ